MPNWLMIACCIVALPYVIVPILIRRTQRFLVKPAMRELLADFLPVNVKNSFNEIDQALKIDQFRHCFDAVSCDATTGVRLFFRAFVHPAQKVFALATAWVSDENANAECKSSIEFISQFVDGWKLHVHNSDLPGAPLNSPRVVSHGFMLVKNPNTLFRIHQFYLKRMMGKKIPILPDNGQEFAVLKQNLGDELALQAEMGALALDASGDYYQLTWAGAFLMAWYNMWPIALLRRLYLTQRAKMWLKRFSSA